MISILLFLYIARANSVIIPGAVWAVSWALMGLSLLLALLSTVLNCAKK